MPSDTTPGIVPPALTATDGSWFLTTPFLSLRWDRLPSGEIRLASVETPGTNWIAAPSDAPSVGNAPDVKMTLRDGAVANNGNSLRFVGQLEPSGATVAITWTVYDSSSIVRAELNVSNETERSIEIGSTASLQLMIPRTNTAQLCVLAGGRWDEALPPRGYRLQTFDLDEIRGVMSFGAADDGRSSGEYVPWFALINDDGGLFAGLVWSGRWSLDIAQQAEANLLSFGIAEFSHRLDPGEHLALPSAIVAGYAGDLDDGANDWRAWVVNHWMPPVPEDWPWIQYNHWYAYYGDIDAPRLLDEARLAAEAGCEVFVIDDGWFRGRRPDSYYAGWGDWVEDRAKFPDGIHAFSEQVQALGMKFGLWVEPERADDGGDLVQQHPDWVATLQGVPITRSGPTGDEGVHLCLGNVEVQRWMTEEMIRVVREYGVEWLKWDYNIGYGFGCDADDHGHQSTDGHYAHTIGLYQVLEGLRTACPDLVIENCASGGHRIDLGTLRHSHTNWVSDYTHRAASCRQHAQGAGLFLPLAHVNTWALEDRDITEFRSRMGGAFGISSFMGKWSADEHTAFKQAVSEYRQLRPFLTGERFLLTGPWHGDWDVWQFVHPSRDDFAVIAFHERGTVSEVRVIPRVPSPGRTYIVQYSSGSSHQHSGHDLASQGITVHLPKARGSEIVWVSAL